MFFLFFFSFFSFFSASLWLVREFLSAIGMDGPVAAPAEGAGVPPSVSARGVNLKNWVTCSATTSPSSASEITGHSGSSECITVTGSDEHGDGNCMRRNNRGSSKRRKSSSSSKSSSNLEVRHIKI